MYKTLYKKMNHTFLPTKYKAITKQRSNKFEPNNSEEAKKKYRKETTLSIYYFQLERHYELV